VIVGRSQPPPETVEELLGPDLAARLDRLDVLSRKILAGKMPGERRSKRRGRSVEFDDFREYVAGDDPRHIDWNIYARLDRLIVKLFREEEDLSLTLLIDASASMGAGDPSKLIYACRLAMALGYVGLVNQNRVSVAALGRGHWPLGLRRPAPWRGRRSARHLGAFLIDLLRETSGRAAEVGADSPPPFEQSMRSLAAGRPPAGVIVLLSDFLFEEGLASGLNYMAPGASGAVDAYAVRLLSPGEEDPTRDLSQGLIGDLRLTDAESGRAAEVTVTHQTIVRFREAMSRHHESVRSECAARGIAWVPLTTSTPVADVVTSTLRRRGLVG
jgi:uncharacterized protein (DUF58 family)